MEFEISAELVGIYLEDAREHLTVVDAALLRLEREGFDPEVVASLLGPLHTLKGNSGMMGFASIKDYVHRLEEVLGRTREGALALDPDFDYAGPPRAYGVFYMKLPWPKRDYKKSEQYLRDSLRRAPQKLVPHLQLVLECERPLAGPARYRLSGVDRVRVGRGTERAVRLGEDGCLTILVPDGWMSSRHAELAERLDFAERLLTKPREGQPGKHWFYRTDRATQRKCWYLRAKNEPTLRTDAPLFRDVNELAWRAPTADFGAWTQRMDAPRLLERSGKASLKTR